MAEVELNAILRMQGAHFRTNFGYSRNNWDVDSWYDFGLSIESCN